MKQVSSKTPSSRPRRKLSLLDDQDGYEALDLIDDDESWPDEMLGPELQMPQYPDDGERRRELRRLHKLGTSPNEQQQGEPGSADAGEPPEAKRMASSGRSTKQT